MDAANRHEVTRAVSYRLGNESQELLDGITATFQRSLADEFGDHGSNVAMASFIGERLAQLLLSEDGFCVMAAVNVKLREIAPRPADYCDSLFTLKYTEAAPQNDDGSPPVHRQHLEWLRRAPTQWAERAADASDGRLHVTGGLLCDEAGHLVTRSEVERLLREEMDV